MKIFVRFFGEECFPAVMDCDKFCCYNGVVKKVIIDGKENEFSSLVIETNRGEVIEDVFSFEVI